MWPGKSCVRLVDEHVDGNEEHYPEHEKLDHRPGCEARDAEDRLRCLYTLIEMGLAELDDILEERIEALIRYDARGTGLSDRDCADFSLQRQIEDLGSIVEAAKCDRFVLLGLWTGGAVAINYAVRHPQRVTHLVLHACATRGRLARDPGPEQIEEAKAQLKLIELGWETITRHSGSFTRRS